MFIMNAVCLFICDCVFNIQLYTLQLIYVRANIYLSNEKHTMKT